MIPEQLQKIFGLKDTKDLPMANNIWKMLDEMAESSPENYRKFIQKNIKEGLGDVKAKKQEAEKPFKIKPHQAFKIQMEANISDQSLVPINNSIQEKLNLTYQSWSDLKKNFPSVIKIILNICHSPRVKLPTLRNKGEIKDSKITLQQLKMIQNLYYSFQGPNKCDQVWQFCMIINSDLYDSIMRQGGKKILMGLMLSYFQQRIKSDKNPIKGQFDAIKYGKNLFYVIDKSTFEIDDVKFIWNGKKQMVQFLLEREVDTQRIQSQTTKKIEKTIPVQVKPEIKFKKEDKKEENQQKPVFIKPQQKSKKVLIEVLSETINQQIPMTMEETSNGYHFQFKIQGINSINDLNLEVSEKAIKMKTEDGRKVSIDLIKIIDQNAVKAKLKKKLGLLIVDLVFKK